VSFALKLFAANVTSLAAVIGAIVLAHAGVVGWDWFLLIALMTTKSVYGGVSNDELDWLVWKLLQLSDKHPAIVRSLMAAPIACAALGQTQLMGRSSRLGLFLKNVN
jgi:hypothetical protein